MTFIFAQRGATCWGFQVGRLYLNVRYLQFWWRSRPRANYVRNGNRPITGPNRAWLYNWPVKLGWER